MTHKELALTILSKLTDLEVRIIAMSTVLDTCYRDLPDGERRAVDWRPEVLQLIQTTRDAAVSRHADRERTIRASTDDCPDALSLLEKVVQDLV